MQPKTAVLRTESASYPPWFSSAEGGEMFSRTMGSTSRPH